MSALPSWGDGTQPSSLYPAPPYGTPTGTEDQLQIRWKRVNPEITDVTPAYNPVQVRRSFAAKLNISDSPSTPPQTSQTTGSPAASKEKFPLSCREYVARAYLPQYAIAGIKREDIEAKLKETIRLATEEGRLWSDSWDAMDLPQVMIQKERALSNLTARAAPWNATGVILSSETNSRKRKSMDNGDDGDAGVLNSTPPWRNANNRNALEDRLTYPTQQQQARQQRFGDDSSPKANSKFQKALEKRRKKFDGGYKSSYKSPSPEPVAGPVVGRCQVLEKKYFRLTSAPNPDNVRPLHVLQRTFDVMKQKWKDEQNYSYICDQFKSMRQDLTVQRIKNEFTVTVYEMHARIALEKGDLGEYNQCQTQLRALYMQNIPGNSVEFKAYRILYFIHTCNRTALNDVLADLTTAEKLEPAIKHALDVRSSLALGNYHRFFRLYLDTPNMGAYLMDMFVTRERLAALSTICKT